jgi:CheY-like chemotaxis protein
LTNLIGWLYFFYGNPPPQVPCHILIVDDDPAVREILPLIIESNGYQTTVCDSGFAALKTYEESLYGEKPVDLVITDYQMPGLTGTQLMMAIKEKKKEVPFIVISSCPNPCLESEEIRVEKNWIFLQKPVRETVLIDAICRSLPENKPPA